MPDNKTWITRFKTASHGEQGLIVGGIAGPIYCAARMAHVSENIPMIGSTAGLNTVACIISGLLVGRYYGDGIGNRLGESIDAWRTNEPLNNRLYLMRIMPLLTGAIAILFLSLFDRYGGKPIFDPVNIISPFEMYLFTFLYGMYIGASLATREGRALDVLTDNRLLADFGLMRLLKQCSQNNSRFQAIGEVNEMRSPLSADANTIRRRSSVTTLEIDRS
ncbi:MAG: hypothetical protein K0S29_708 [Gammaproteobacteria bacterium]|jgi:MFS family permease|nr:hypothetical protein [Gammaproteobacteria bacterium]